MRNMAAKISDDTQVAILEKYIIHCRGVAIATWGILLWYYRANKQSRN